MTGNPYERSPSFFERLFCLRCRRQQRSALPNRNTGQRKYVEEVTSSSEEESESVTEEECESDEAMEDTVSEEITSERVGFENQMDASKAQTR